MKTKTVFYCTECGNETPKWAGRCPACGAWNSIVEQTDKPVKSGRKPASARAVKPVPIMDIGTADEIRFSTGMGELDRVLGGGAVKGSLVLVGGAPGIGKSTPVSYTHLDFFGYSLFAYKMRTKIYISKSHPVLHTD